MVMIAGIFNSVRAETARLSTVDKALLMAAVTNHVPVRLLKAICQHESRLNPKALNKYDKGSPSYGLCQIKAATARYVGYSGNARGLFNPYTNAHYAARYLRYQLTRYDEDWVKATSAYNAGRAHKVIRNTKYVRLVWKNMELKWEPLKKF